MRSSVVYLTMSAVAGVGGLVLLVVLCYIHVTPAAKVRELRETSCNVTLLRLIRGATDDGNVTVCGNEAVASSGCCVHVQVRYNNVLYRSSSREVMTGTLYFDSQTLHRRQELKACFCDTCDIRVTPGRSDFEVMSVQVSGRHLRVGDTLPCLYWAREGPMLLRWRQGSLGGARLHAMLWPTLMFICGFVGLFFSCLRIQQDQANGRNTDIHGGEGGQEVPHLPMNLLHKRTLNLTLPPEDSTISRDLTEIHYV